MSVEWVEWSGVEWSEEDLGGDGGSGVEWSEGVSGGGEWRRAERRRAERRRAGWSGVERSEGFGSVPFVGARGHGHSPEG
jgi:hypothetical protein